jgi:hypothetical protein
LTGQPLRAARLIGIGQIVILILGPTQSSGSDHDSRLDLAAESVGLSRVHLLTDPVPMLDAGQCDLDAVRDPFVAAPFGNDNPLLPETLGRLTQPFQSE